LTITLSNSTTPVLKVPLRPAKAAVTRGTVRAAPSPQKH
jgi:hypothetical protein